MDTPSRIAARWWADNLRNGHAKLDNGDTSTTGGMTMMLGMLAQANAPRVTPEQAQAFEDALVVAIEKAPAYQGRYLTLGVDYGPDLMLSNAAATAGVRLTMTTLPWKTVMWVKPDQVTLRHGYGAPTQTLFPATDAVTP